MTAIVLKEEKLLLCVFENVVKMIPIHTDPQKQLKTLDVTL